MPIAAMWGKSVGYTDQGDVIMIETSDSRIAMVRKETFEYLYYRLDDFTAALKEDCIEYVQLDNETDLFEHPEWYVGAVEDGMVYQIDGVDMFYEERGEIAISPDSVIMKNYLGQLMYMESDIFEKYYDITGE